MVLDITTQGSAGLTGSEPSACKGKLSIGDLMPAMFATTLLLPAATIPIFLAAMKPRDVSTPSTAPEAPRRVRPHRAVAAATVPVFSRRNEAAGRPHAFARAGGATPYPRHLAILEDIDAARVGRSGISPRHRVMPRRSTSPLQGAAQNRIAHGAAHVQRRAEVLALLRRQPFIVDPVQAIGVDVPPGALDVMDGVRQRQD